MAEGLENAMLSASSSGQEAASSALKSTSSYNGNTNRNSVPAHTANARTLSALSSSIGSALNQYQQTVFNQNIQHRTLDIQQQNVDIAKLRALDDHQKALNQQTEYENSNSAVAMEGYMKQAADGDESFQDAFSNGSTWAVHSAEQAASDRMSKKLERKVSVRYVPADNDSAGGIKVDKNGQPIYKQIMYDSGTGEALSQQEIGIGTIKNNTQDRLNELGIADDSLDYEDHFSNDDVDADTSDYDPSHEASVIARMYKNHRSKTEIDKYMQQAKIAQTANLNKYDGHTTRWKDDNSLRGGVNLTNAPEQVSGFHRSNLAIGRGEIDKKNKALQYVDGNADTHKTKNYRILSNDEQKNIQLYNADGSRNNGISRSREDFIKREVRSTLGTFFDSSPQEKEEAIRKGTLKYNKFLKKIRTSDPNTHVIDDNGKLKIAYTGTNYKTRYTGDKAAQAEHSQALLSSFSDIGSWFQGRRRKRFKEGKAIGLERTIGNVLRYSAEANPLMLPFGRHTENPVGKLVDRRVAKKTTAMNEVYDKYVANQKAQAKAQSSSAGAK